MTIYYIYAYIREFNSPIAKAGTPYYIGKGKDKRAWSTDHSVYLPKNKKNIVILEAGLTEIGALALERRLIKWWGRVDIQTGILRNKTDGGEGASNRKLYKTQTGILNPSFDKTIYTFYNKNGLVEKCTQYELRCKYNLNSSNLSEVINGNQKSVKGWRITEHELPNMTGKLQPNCNTIYKFEHKTGIIEHLTQRELYLKYNLPCRSGISQVVSKKTKSYKGWKIIF